MQNVVFSILLSLSFITQPNFNSCSDFYENHPVKSDIMLQIVLKSYGYYEGKIDGKFGNSSKKAFVFFQGNHNLSPDGVLGQQTCKLLLNKKILLETTNKKNLMIQLILKVITHKKYMMPN